MSILSIGIEQGLAEGLTKGQAKALADATLELLKDYGTIPEDVLQKIMAEKNLDTLKLWHKKAARVNSIEDFQKYLDNEG